MGKKNNKKESEEGKSQNSFMEIDNEFNQYIREISRNLDNVQDDEEKFNLINNFIEAIPEGKYEAVALHGLGSKIIDSLLPYSSPEIFEKFTVSLSNLRKLVNSKKSSFVLESSIKTACIRALSERKTEKEDPEEPVTKKGKYSKRSTEIIYNLDLEIKVGHQTYCKEYVTKVSKFLLNNIEDFMNSDASYFIRTCLAALAGIVSFKTSDRGLTNQVNLITEHQKSVETEWIDISNEFATRVISWPHFSELAFNQNSSTFLQILCQSLHNLKQHETLKKLIKSIMKKCFKDEEDNNEEEIKDIELIKPFNTKSSQFLLESILQFSDEKLFKKIFNKYIKQNLVMMCDTHLNYTVQRLIDCVKDKNIFEEIFNILSPLITTLLQNGKTGVVLAICKACDRLSFKQGQFLHALTKSLECETAQNHVIQCIVSLMPLQVVEKNTEIEVHLHGSLILQHILKFNKPIKIVQNLLDMKPQHLSDIFCHPKGSRICDAYIESKFIGEKSREKLANHLASMYVKLALSKNGSHALERIFQAVSDASKELIVKELSERQNQLSSSPSGKIILNTLLKQRKKRN